MKFFLSFILLFVVLFAPAQIPSIVNPARAGFSSERLSRFDAYMDQKIESEELVGAVCIITRNGYVAHQKTYGFSNLETKAAMQNDQIFYIQSMTKPIISVGIMMLYEEGYFELNDPVSKYLPEFQNMKVASFNEQDQLTYAPAAEPIRMWHLLSHTAGLSHGLGNSKLDVMYRDSLYGVNSLGKVPHKTIRDRALVLAKLPLIAAPGEKWYYSAAPDVLSLLIEQFSGMTTADFLKKRIFEPLEMNDTGYNLSEEQAAKVANLHLLKDQKQTKAPFQTPTKGNTIFGGTHGLFSTANDCLKFCTMLLQDGKYKDQQLLSPKTIELMTSNHVGDKYEKGMGFGLGFGVRTDLADSKMLGTEGLFHWTGAYNTYFFIDPKENLVAILMMQFAPYSDNYNRAFRQFVYQAIANRNH